MQAGPNDGRRRPVPQNQPANVRPHGQTYHDDPYGQSLWPRAETLVAHNANTNAGQTSIVCPEGVDPMAARRNDGPYIEAEPEAVVPIEEVR